MEKLPQMLHLSGEDSPLGAQFLVMEHLEGRVFWDPALPEQSPKFRQDAYHALVRTLAALHDVDPQAVGLADFGKPGNYFSRQVARWTGQYRACETQTRPDMDWTIAWLERNIRSRHHIADDERSRRTRHHRDPQSKRRAL